MEKWPVLGLENEVPLELPLKDWGGPHPPARKLGLVSSRKTGGAGIIGVKLESGWTRVMVRTYQGVSLQLPAALGTLPL